MYATRYGLRRTISTISRIRRLWCVVPFLLGFSGVGAQEGFWDKERPLGPEINSHWAAQSTLSADGLMMVFAAKSRPGGAGGRDLWMATRSSTSDEFDDVRNLTNINRPGNDDGPSLSRDGSRLYFTRLLGFLQIDIFVADWLPEEETFGPPTPVLGQVNTNQIEVAPVISPDELALYFTRNGTFVPDGDGDLYVATRTDKDQPFDEVMELHELNSTDLEDEAASISSDGMTLFFHRTNFQTARMWMATRESRDAPFGEPVKLPPSVNTGLLVGAPFISADWPAPGSKLYFTRCSSETCQIYEATWHPTVPCDTHLEGVDAALIDSAGGNVSVSASATDDTGDAISYTFRARGGTLFDETIGPQAASTAVFDLPPGECYTISVTVGDNSECNLPAEDATEVIESFCVPEAGGLQTPADCNQDGTLDLSDGTCLLGGLFLGNPKALPCGDGAAGDPGNVSLLDSNGDGNVDLSDAVAVFGFLFLGTPGPVLGTECVPIVGCSASVGCDS